MKARIIGCYDKEFKINGVKLYLTGGKKHQEVSKELGILTAG